MTELAYLRRHPLRVVKIHAVAWIRAAILPVAALVGGGGSDADVDGGEGFRDDEVPDILPAGVQREVVPKAEEQRDKIKRSASGKKIHLPAYFQRTPAKHYMVAELEGPIDRLRMINMVMPGRRPEGDAYRPIDSFPVVADPSRGFIR